MRRDKAWPISTELLAQLIEEVGVLAAEHRRKKPRQVPRPGQPHRRQRRRPVAAGHGASSVAPAVAAMRGAARTVYRHPGGDVNGVAPLR
jgi:hypothetical protein